MKNIFKKPSVLVALLCAVMMATFAVSFAYWKSGIEGNQKDRVIDINIGEGNAFETVVNLGSVNVTDDYLIPHNRIPVAGEVNKIEFQVKVTWTGFDPQGQNQELFESHVGKLTPSCILIELGSQNENVTSETGLDGMPLFDVSFDKATYNILGNDDDGVIVTVTVRMAEPIDKAQYDRVAGSSVKISLRFVVESQYDQGLVF